MANIEYGSKWNFAPCLSGMMEQGPNNPLWEHFRSQSKYDTLVREAIQNSLDAVYDKDIPVRVEFAFEELENPSKNMPEFLKIRDYIKGCIEYWKDNQDAKRVCQPMLDFLNSSKDRIPYLRVSDYNTRGMDYRENDNNCTFYGFLRGQGTSVKNNSTSGGSFGFGKTAYFGFSEFYTILISSMNQKKNVVFEGASMLCTNKTNGQKYVDVGYYDCNNGQPITDANKIPDNFRRTEPGTDINVMGIYDDPDSKKQCILEIVQCVLKNFWMAILMEKLEVKIGNNNITAAKLPKLMEACYQVIADNNSLYENPRPYYEAVRGALSKNNLCKHYHKHLHTLGSVHMYVMRNPHNRDRVIAMRQPMMVVKTYNMHSQKGFAAVFVCDDENGNELLRLTEPPTHSNWERGRVADSNNQKHKDAHVALGEVKKFLLECITDFFFNEMTDEADFMGVEDLLYSVDAETEATPTNQKVQQQAQSEEGTPTGETIQTVTSSPTTSLKPETPTYSVDLSKQDRTGQVSIKTVTKAKQDDRGRLTSGNSSKPRKQQGGGGVGSEKTNNRNVKSDEGNSGSYQVPFPVAYRCFAQNDANGTTYTLKYNSDRDAEKGIINIFVVGADGEEEIPLSWSSEGTIVGNAIHGLKVKEGKNVLQFRFNDNMKHAVYLKVYEEN